MEESNVREAIMARPTGFEPVTYGLEVRRFMGFKHLNHIKIKHNKNKNQ